MKASALFNIPLLSLTAICLVGPDRVQAQNFVGTNAPGAATNFSVVVPAGATNFSLVISNSSTAYSHLLLKKGGTPTDTDFDFISRLNGRTNQINLELPEFTSGSYGLRVRTPGASATQAFRVFFTTNRTDLRSGAYPALKPHIFTTTGSLTNNTNNGTWHYFQVDVPTNLPGWRVTLSHTGAGNPDLFVRRGLPPTQFSFDKGSQNQSIDTLTFTDTEATNFTYFIGVFLPPTAPGNTTYTLSAELGYLTQLAWDPGTIHQGSQVFTNTSPSGGDYFFRITTQTPSVGAWRTALYVDSGEADVAIRQNTFSDQYSQYSFRQSARVGSDGWVLHSSEFGPAQDWFIAVHASPGAQWRLFSGDVFVTNLGTLAADASSGSGPVPMGAEGMRFFRTTTTVDTLAWRLWLNGGNNPLLVRDVSVPHPRNTGTYDWQSVGQMLLVPTYLVGGQSYFISVIGNPGETINLDSRKHGFTDLTFNSTTNFTITGYGYTTFRVQVPVQQIAWLNTVTPSSGDANVAIRRDFIPNEFFNGAFSDVTGSTADSVSLVPPTLSDGTFYVTVYGSAPYTCSLFSGNPQITDVGYVSTTLNSDVARVGWRYFRVPDISSQLGSLGWDLLLSNYVAGTELAIRQNAVPSRWNFRNGSASSSSSAHIDFTGGTSGFLQRPGHQADIWYIGIYNPTNALGPFSLILQQLTAALAAFDGSSISRSAATPGRWEYFRVDVPANCFGWDLRLVNVLENGAQPMLVVRRDQLPDALGTGPWATPQTGTSWPSGYRWRASSDWTSRQFNPAGTVNEDNRILAVGLGRPLEPGTYYVGVNNQNNSNPMTYTVQSRGIGAGFTIPITPVAFAGGSVTNTLAPREAAYYSVSVPSNTPSWKLKMRAANGESLLIALRGVLPNVLPSGGVTGDNDSGLRMQKLDDEQFALLPASGQTNLVPGNYYLAAVSEGINVTNNNRIGTGSSTHEVTSLGVLPVTALGALAGPDLLVSGSLESGALAAYQFTVPAGTLAMEVRLENKTGTPAMALIPSALLPAANTSSYGTEGGHLTGRLVDDTLINVANPTATNWSIVIKANAIGANYPPATYDLRVHRLFATNVVFDGGTAAVTNHEAGTWRYFQIQVPSNAFGWDIRLVNVPTNCDPQFSVRRDFAPSSLGTLGWSIPQTSLTWPTGNQWAASFDWTGRQFNPAGTIDENGRILAMGMGRPLEPGNYFIGVINGSGTNSMTYTLQSRGIGTNMTIPVQSLAFAGGSYSTNGLPAREAAYFCVNVPSNTPSWKLKLSTNASEAELIVLRSVLPSVAAGGNAAASPNDAGAEIQKTGDEHFLLLPQQGQTNIPAGAYYLALVAEGANATNSSRIGAGTSGFTIDSVGPLSVTSLGVLTPVDIIQPGALQGGEVAAYQFEVPPGTLSMEVRLENRVGNPGMALRPGAALPVPYSGSYGQEGGWSNLRVTDDEFLTLANPSNGVYTLMVKANIAGNFYSNATYTIHITAVTATPIAFDGGSVTVANHPANTWRYYRIDVPAGPFGWDIRLLNVPTNGNSPRLVVRRDQLPSSLGSSGWSVPQTSLTWPTGNAWAAGSDWSGRQSSPDGQINESGRILAMGMGRPLEPGTYYIGVIDSGSDTNALAYTLLSRGIGTNQSIGITTLGFAGGTTNHPGLAPREAAYFCVNVPSNTPSWRIRLAATSGDSLLAVLRSVLPSIAAGGSAAQGNNDAGAKMLKAGNEHFLLLPNDGQTNIPAGSYYLAVASEGMNLTNSSRIGVGTSQFTLTSQDTLPIFGLGTVGGAILTPSHTLEGGEVRAYQFDVAAGVQAFEAQLLNRVGNPNMALRQGAGLPFTGPDSYGEEGGYNGGRLANDSILTVANPSNSIYSLTVKAASLSSSYPDSSYTLRVQHIPVVDLSFAPNLNTPTQTNVVGKLLADNQRAYYRVVVPATNNGHDVIGWRLVLSQISGTADLRVRKGVLPSDAGGSPPQSPFGQGDYVVVAPYLTPGAWYVEVRGTGSTEFRLESDELLLERPAWVMQQSGQPTTTPGLTAPNFGDTGVDVFGNPLPGDHGIDLERGFFHYYALVVPTNNSGVMRVVLEAINGNPDFYMRTSAPPTLAHGPAGPAGTPLYDRSLTDTTTEYASWVTENGRYEHELTSGVCYIAIRAVTSNVRYRLRLSAGVIQDLPLSGGSLANQTIAAGDWLYYRVQIPTNAPVQWLVSFNQILGDIIMYVRDTTPPGQGSTVTEYIDWADDTKNHGPYPTYDPAGLNTLLVPPVRPGHTYYLGFRALTDATFSLNSATAGGNIDVTNVVAFYGGVTNTVIPPGGVLRFRVDVPPDARRWTHYTTNAASVWFHLDQGSLPTLTTFDHFFNHNGSHTLTHALYTENNWPWYPGYIYFITVTNTALTAQSFYFRMDGRDCNTDDSDNDQLPDCWELMWWPSIASYSTFSDPDGDGIPNIVEYQNGSNPTVADAGFYFTNSVVLPNASFSTLFIGPTNGRYRWQAASTVTGVWTQIRFFTNANARTVLTDTNATNFPRRFYRAIAP